MDAPNAWNINQVSSTAHFIDRLISQLSECCTTQPENAVTAAQHHQPPHPNQTPTSAFPFPSPNVTQLKPLMLTLHCIFPNELLLALDLLDRGFVRRLIRRQDGQTHNQNRGQSNTSNRAPPEPSTQVQQALGQESGTSLPPSETRLPREDLFFVLSASSSSSAAISSSQSSFSIGEHQNQKGYEVRLQAWNCTCPSFTLAAFRNVGPESPPTSSPGAADVEIPDEMHYAPNSQYSFGGTLTRASSKASPPVCKHILASFLAALCPGLVREDGCSLSVTVEELAAFCAG